jgi:hypothetical protein
MAIVRSGFIELYIDALKLSKDQNQTVGEKNDYYITLEQLQNLIVKLENQR